MTDVTHHPVESRVLVVENRLDGIERTLSHLDKTLGSMRETLTSQRPAIPFKEIAITALTCWGIFVGISNWIDGKIDAKMSTPVYKIDQLYSDKQGQPTRH